MPAKSIYNWPRAKQVFPPLCARHEAKLDPYHKPIVQDAMFMPQGFVWGSRKHSLYLFFLCIYMKGGITSSAAITSLSRFYEDHPEIFLPENLLGLEDYEIAWVIEWLGQVLKEYGLGVNIEESKRTWVYNSLKLARFWNSDPRTIFVTSDSNAENAWSSYQAAKANYDAICIILIRKKSLTHDELMQTPNGFYGFQHKMVSMIIYFYDHASIILSVPYPPPVDFHVLRVLLSTGVLRMRKNKKKRWGTYRWEFRERFLPAAREVTLRYIVVARVNSIRFAEALWLPSRNWCRNHPGNKSSVEKSRKARSRHITDFRAVFSASAEYRYHKMCGQCPVESICKWNIPSAYYYVKGVIILRWVRERPHNGNRLQPTLLEVPITIHQNGNGNGKRHDRALPVLTEVHPSLFD